MDDAAAALRPIDEVADAIARLHDYDSATELSTAIAAVWSAVQRALRLRLRADRAAPDPHRLRALSERDLPIEEVIQSLRAREVISLPTAGALHELRSAAARAREGTARPGDADVALAAVRKVRADLGADAQGAPAAEAGPEGIAAREPHPGPGDSEVPPERRGRWMAWLAAALALAFLGAMAWVLSRDEVSHYDVAVAAFRAGRLDSAAVSFERALENRPGDVSIMLYLGRIHRRQDRPAEAAAVLREAVRIAPQDSDVRREMGHLFMDLRQPAAAAAQYERALESDPTEARTWASLIRALRAAGDPRADRLLADAPPEVRAALGGS